MDFAARTPKTCMIGFIFSLVFFFVPFGFATKLLLKLLQFFGKSSHKFKWHTVCQNLQVSPTSLRHSDCHRTFLCSLSAKKAFYAKILKKKSKTNESKTTYP